MPISLRALVLPLIVTLVAIGYGPVLRRIEVLGVLRRPSTTRPGVTEQDWAIITGTPHCEDIHYHIPSGKIFTACDDHESRPRFAWYPPVSNFDDPEAAAQGSLLVIDPESMKAQKLTLENFEGPFVTHGIDLLTDPEDPRAVYIYAINHPPTKNPNAADGTAPKAQSQIELFRHVLESNTATHIRSIRHPLVFTPNDLHVASPNSFYVTNDHLYRSGALRQFEDFITAAKWSNLVHVDFALTPTSNPDQDVTAHVALTGIHNANGMGHITTPDNLDAGEVFFTSSSSGLLFIARPTGDSSHNLTLLETIELPSCLDNPSHYTDPYATEDSDATGFILAGLMRGAEAMNNIRQRDAKDPSMVWYLKKNATATAGTPADQKWIRKLIFEDDGSRLRFATTALVVPIDPKKEAGKKKGWLFATGLLSESIVAVKVDL